MLTINRNNHNMAFTLTYCVGENDKLNAVFYNGVHYYMFYLCGSDIIAYNHNKADGTVILSPFDLQDTFDRTILIPLSK